MDKNYTSLFNFLTKKTAGHLYLLALLFLVMGLIVLNLPSPESWIAIYFLVPGLAFIPLAHLLHKIVDLDKD